jgi:hypothetical protein
MSLFTVQFSAVYVLLGSKYSPRHSVLKHFQSLSSLVVRGKVWEIKNYKIKRLTRLRFSMH